MFTFAAKNLLRGLDVAAMPARQADSNTPVLCTVQLRFTDQGLIALSTDRYQLARTLAPYQGEEPTVGAPDVRLHRDGIKMLLPVLKAGKYDTATISADRETVTVECAGQTIKLENHAQWGDYPRVDSLFRLHQGENVARNAEPFAAVAPAYLHAITTMMKRYTGRSGAVEFSLDRSSTAKPIAWMMEDWAHGVLMPVRRESTRTREEEMREDNGGLTRLFDAVTLPELGEAEQAEQADREEVPVGV